MYVTPVLTKCHKLTICAIVAPSTLVIFDHSTSTPDYMGCI
jgi:hypothetical protein